MPDNARHTVASGPSAYVPSVRNATVTGGAAIVLCASSRGFPALRWSPPVHSTLLKGRTSSAFSYTLNSLRRVWKAPKNVGWMNKGLSFFSLKTKQKLLKCFDIHQLTQNAGISDQMFSPSAIQMKRESCWWCWSSKKKCFPYQQKFQAWTKAESRVCHTA